MKPKLHRAVYYLVLVEAARNYLARRWSLNLLFVLFSVAGVGQAEASLRVAVADKPNEEPLPFAVVAITDKSSIVTGSLEQASP